MTKIINPEECWVAVETWRYPDGSIKRFRTTRQTKELAESYLDDGYIREPGDAGLFPERISCHIERATPAEMMDLCLSERHMMRKLSG